MLICARKGCEESFERKTHNQKFHSDECCRLSTNERIMEKYYENRNRKRGKVRLCNVCEETKLSRYNENNICSSCETKKDFNANSSVLEMLNNASFAF